MIGCVLLDLAEPVSDAWGRAASAPRLAGKPATAGNAGGGCRAPSKVSRSETSKRSMTPATERQSVAREAAAALHTVGMAVVRLLNGTKPVLPSGIPNFDPPQLGVEHRLERRVVQADGRGHVRVEGVLRRPLHERRLPCVRGRGEMSVIASSGQPDRRFPRAKPGAGALAEARTDPTLAKHEDFEVLASPRHPGGSHSERRPQGTPARAAARPVAEECVGAAVCADAAARPIRAEPQGASAVAPGGAEMSGGRRRHAVTSSRAHPLDMAGARAPRRPSNCARRAPSHASADGAAQMLTPRQVSTWARCARPSPLAPPARTRKHPFPWHPHYPAH